MHEFRLLLRNEGCNKRYSVSSTREPIAQCIGHNSKQSFVIHFVEISGDRQAFYTKNEYSDS